MLESFKGEILSPVGNWEMLHASVRSGADAVYLGAKDFSARRNAENFTTDELAEIVKFCHIRSVKVYLTLNILIKDSEFSNALNLASAAYNAGIDGIIVQDLGLAKVLHDKLPELPLHASTQMSIHSPSCLPILNELGFRQVVVAREMSLADLTAFCKEAEKYNITVEAFVHGALCMSVSGQCLLSAFLGSRSGNRGLCAGPCRLPFSAPNGTGYDLSLKEPYSGQVPIMTGEIAEDLTYYFAKSDQVPTAMGLGVLVNPDNSVSIAGGFMIQLMPEATEEVAGIIEDKMAEIPPITTMLKDGMSPEDILFYLTDGFSMIMQNETVTPKYQCKCSKHRMERAVISIGKEELRKIIDEDEKCEVECRFCNNKYVFSKDELLEMNEKAK